jgi:hypothetical protein
MAALAADVKRAYEVNEDELNIDVPCVASDIVYEGAMLGNSSGNARPLVASDSFVGIALRRCDNSAGAAGDLNVRAKTRGSLQVAVTGVTGVGDVNSTVYCSSDNDFTLTSTGNTSIGKVRRYVSGTTVIVRFEANSVRSL